MTHDVAAHEHARRKAEHITAAVSLGDGWDGGPGWEDIRLVHQAVPVIDTDDVDLGTRLLGHDLRLPVVIAGMTGGFPDARGHNRVLAQAAEATGVAIGVGSQRAALRDPSLIPTYSVVREAAPSAFVIANIGGAQLVDQPGEAALTRDQVRSLVDMVAADALAVHLNFVEELVQPEGQRRAAGLVAAIERLCSWLPIPVIAKETGSGLSEHAASVLRDAGVQALDVGGRGGTSFRAVEHERAVTQAADAHVAMGQALAGWGIPTPVSVVASRGGVPVIATGGIRNGVEAAKAIALGAHAVGVGRPLMECALDGVGAVITWIERLADELRAACFLTGGRSVVDLPHAQLVVTGETEMWLRQLKLHA